MRLSTLVAAATLLAACGPKPRERVLVVLGRPPIVSLDPQSNDDYFAHNVFRNVFDPLVAMDAELRLAPALAVSWSNPSDLLWRFELRPGVRFHDGREFTAADVKATLDRARTRPGSWLAADLALVSDVRTLSPTLLEVETRLPIPLLLSRLAEIPVLPDGKAAGDRPAGTGPYRVSSFVAGHETVLERFDTSWRGRAYWDRAVFRADPDGRSRVERLLRGEADLIEAPPIEELPRLRSGGQAKLLERAGAQVAVLGLNAAKRPGNPFAQLEARRAVSLSLDREALVREALSGNGAPASQLAAPAIVGYVPGIAPPPRDLQAARAALAKAGITRGLASTLQFSERDRRLAETVARQADAAGISFQLEELPWHVLDAKLRARSSPAHIFVATFPSGDATELLLDLHTPTSDGLFGLYNFTGYSDPGLDTLMEQADLAMSPHARMELLERAQRRAALGHAMIPLVIPSQRFAMRNHLAWAGHALGRIDLDAVSELPTTPD